MAAYRVAERTQVAAAGVVYDAGAVVELDDETAAPLVASGIVTVEPVAKADVSKPDS